MITRRDLSVEQRAVQSGHALIELGRKNLIPAGIEHPSVIICEVKTELQLRNWFTRLDEAGLNYAHFCEPDLSVLQPSRTKPLVHGRDPRLELAKAHGQFGGVAHLAARNAVGHAVPQSVVQPVNAIIDEAVVRHVVHGGVGRGTAITTGGLREAFDVLYRKLEGFLALLGVDPVNVVQGVEGGIGIPDTVVLTAAMRDASPQDIACKDPLCLLGASALAKEILAPALPFWRLLDTGNDLPLAERLSHFIFAGVPVVPKASATSGSAFSQASFTNRPCRLCLALALAHEILRATLDVGGLGTLSKNRPQAVGATNLDLVNHDTSSQHVSSAVGCGNLSHIDHQLTAIAVEPIYGDQRHLFRHLQLMKSTTKEAANVG